MEVIYHVVHFQFVMSIQSTGHFSAPLPVTLPKISSSHSHFNLFKIKFRLNRQNSTFMGNTFKIKLLDFEKKQSHLKNRNSVIVRADADYYDILGVPRSASKKEIKSAYRQKARKFHPVQKKEK